MRGEETLTFGLLEKFKPAGPVLVINLGSHTKFIGVDAKGVITGSLTTLAGELLAALKAQTVLASSLPFELPSTGKPNFQRVLAGASLAEEAGLLRSAFVVRVLDQLIGLLPEECFDFLSGAVAASDLEALTSWQGMNTRRYFSLKSISYSYLCRAAQPQGAKHQYYLRSRVRRDYCGRCHKADRRRLMMKAKISWRIAKEGLVAILRGLRRTQRLRQRRP